MRIAALIAITWTSTLLSGRAEAQPSADVQVWTGDQRLAEALTQGAVASATLRRLLDTITSLPVRVQLRGQPCWTPSATACSQLTGRVGEVRYVLVHLVPQRARDELPPLIGHELRHALEIGCDRSTGDAPSMAALFGRIGIRIGKQRYETREALAVEAAIRREVQHGDVRDTTELTSCGQALPSGGQRTATASEPRR
jgi:hypothetical protein